MKRIVLVLVVSLTAAACGGGGLLDGLGDRSKEIVYAGVTTTTVRVIDTVVAGPVGAARASDLVWYNDGIAGEGHGEPNQVIAAVWSRGDGSSPAIQASRGEIAAALPGIEFPELVPENVKWVTSQLVFDVASATLGADTSAQFGLWHLEPYTAEGGRSAVMWVRPAGPNDPIGQIVPEGVEAGLNLSWVSDGYQYRIFCPIGLIEDQCWQMAETAMPLSMLVPDEPTG